MLHDVTKPLYEGIPVWPGDVEFKRRTVENQGFYSSSVTMSLHTGTHMDAPAHRFREGRTIDSCGPFILRAALGTDPFEKDTAVLFRGPVDEGTAERLVSAGVALVGTGSISIDHDGSTAAHELILGAGIPVVENLDLSGIEPGKYILMAFPLKFAGADGSPVRVILADSPEDILP